MNHTAHILNESRRAMLTFLEALGYSVRSSRSLEASSSFLTPSSITGVGLLHCAHLTVPSTVIGEHRPLKSD